MYWKNVGVTFAQPSLPMGNFNGLGKKYHTSDLMLRFYKELKGKGIFGGVYLFTTPIVIATDLEFIKTVLIKDFNYFKNRGTYFNESDDPLSANLFNIEDEKWQNLRTKLTPTFTSGKMKMMVSLNILLLNLIFYLFLTYLNSFRVLSDWLKTL